MDRFNMDRLRNAVDDAKNVVKARMGSDVDRKVEEALSNKNWGASSTLLNEISQLTFEYEAFTVIMRKIYEALDCHARQWRTVFKGLTLLEHLVKNGTERVVENARDHMFKIRSLSDFNYYDGTADKGAGVREKAKALLDLLNDNDRIRDEREKARRLRDKYVGIGSGVGGGMGGGGYGGNMGGGGYGGNMGGSGYGGNMGGGGYGGNMGGGGYGGNNGGGGGYRGGGYNAGGGYKENDTYSDGNGTYARSRYDDRDNRNSGRDDSQFSRRDSDDGSKDRYNEGNGEDSEEEDRPKRRVSRKKKEKKREKKVVKVESEEEEKPSPGLPSNAPSLLDDDDDFFGSSINTVPSQQQNSVDTFDPFSTNAPVAPTVPAPGEPLRNNSINNTIDSFRGVSSSVNPNPVQQHQSFQAMGNMSMMGGNGSEVFNNSAPSSGDMSRNMAMMGNGNTGYGYNSNLPGNTMGGGGVYQQQQSSNSFSRTVAAPSTSSISKPSVATSTVKKDAWGAANLFDLSDLKSNNPPPANSRNSSQVGGGMLGNGTGMMGMGALNANLYGSNNMPNRNSTNYTSNNSFSGLDTLAGLPNKQQQQPMQQPRNSIPMGQQQSMMANPQSNMMSNNNMQQQQMGMGMGIGGLNNPMHQQQPGVIGMGNNNPINSSGGQFGNNMMNNNASMQQQYRQQQGGYGGHQRPF